MKRREVYDDGIMIFQDDVHTETREIVQWSNGRWGWQIYDMVNNVLKELGNYETRDRAFTAMESY